MSHLVEQMACVGRAPLSVVSRLYRVVQPRPDESVLASGVPGAAGPIAHSGQ